MQRRVKRRVQKKYDPSESFSSRDIRLAIQLSLGKSVETQQKNESKLPASSDPSETKINDTALNRKKKRINAVEHKSRSDKKDTSVETDDSVVNKTLAKKQKKVRKNPTGISTRPRRNIKKKKLAPEKKEKPSDVKKATNAKFAVKETEEKNIREAVKTPGSGSPMLGGSSGRKRQSSDIGEEMKYKGIRKLEGTTGRFRANLSVDGHNYHLGDYDSALGAACSYDQARIHMIDDDEKELNFDWYMPSQGNVGRNIIKKEYIRMLTHVSKTGPQSRAKGSKLSLKSNRISQLHAKEALENIIETTQTEKTERNKNEDKESVSKEEQMRRNSELLQQEKIRQDKWWFKNYLNDEENTYTQGAMNLLSRTKQN